MKIKCKDGFLHEDEILANCFDNEMEFRGCIYNINAWEAIREFYKEIEGARLKFYEALMRDQRTEEQKESEA